MSANPSQCANRTRFRSTADESAEERIDSAAQRCPDSSGIHITVSAESCNVQRSHRFGSFSTSNDEDPLLIRTGAPGSLSNIQVHTLCSSQSLIPELRIRNRSVLHRHKQLASDLIRSQGFVWKSRPVRHRRPPSKNGAAGEADDDERTTVEAQRERSELEIVILIEILASPSDNAEGVGAGLLPIQIAIANGYFLESVYDLRLRFSFSFPFSFSFSFYSGPAHESPYLFSAASQAWAISFSACSSSSLALAACPPSSYSFALCAAVSLWMACFTSWCAAPMLGCLPLARAGAGVRGAARSAAKIRVVCS